MQSLKLGLVKDRLVLKIQSAKKLCKEYGIDTGLGHVADVILIAKQFNLTQEQTYKLIGKFFKNPFRKPKEVYDEIRLITGISI